MTIKPYSYLCLRCDENHSSEIGCPVIVAQSEPDNWMNCKSRREFEQYLFRSFVRHYGLTCTCDEGIESDVFQAGGHYQRCAYWKFCHTMSRSLDWAEAKNGILP